MKIYISVDIEGIAGIAHWDETTLGKSGNEIFREQMTRETVAACEGAIAAGATEIIVKEVSPDHYNSENKFRCNPYRSIFSLRWNINIRLLLTSILFI